MTSSSLALSEKPVDLGVVKHPFLRSLQKLRPNQHGFSTTFHTLDVGKIKSIGASVPWSYPFLI